MFLYPFLNIEKQEPEVLYDEKYMSLFLAAAHSLEFYYPHWPEHRWVQLLLPRIWQLFLSVVWLKDSWEGTFETYREEDDENLYCRLANATMEVVQ